MQTDFIPTKQVNIALVSDSEERIQKLSALLTEPNNRVKQTSFVDAGRHALFELSLDLVILDCVSHPDFDYRNFESVRINRKLETIPFIFILDKNQDNVKRQVYKIPRNSILIEPIDKFLFISTVTGTLHLSQLEHSNTVYRDIIDGEKKLVSYMDEILEMNQIVGFTSEEQLNRHLQSEFVKRLELTLAVETALFAKYNSENNILSIDIFDDKKKKLKKRHSYEIKNSIILKLIEKKLPHIFSSKETDDIFIQEVEESFGFKIEGLLFVPISIFHQPKAAIILINKLYRNEFSESDLAFGLLASQKISLQFENIYLSRIDPVDNSETTIVSIFGNENKIFQEWNLYHQVMSSVNFGMIVFDPDFNIDFINKTANQILERAEDSKPAKNLKQLFGKTEFEYIKNVLISKELPIIREELQLPIKNLPNYYIGFSIYQHEINEYLKKYILVFSEITQTKKIQAEIIRMDRMASLGVLSSGIAHEIRNPLAGIKAMVQTLEEEMSPGSSQLEYVDRILRQVNRLDDLLKAFFSYARPQRPDPSATNIKNIIDEVLPLFQRKMRDKDISIFEDYDADLHLVFVDSNQIQQVIFNLFLNAIDAMSRGGKLSIIAKNALDSEPLIDRRHSIPGLISKNYIEIFIKDTGSGVPQDIIDKIFNPFFTTKSNGTGLGLSIVYQIIKEHGGQIEVESEPEKGSVFRILLPALEKQKN
jgi:signal transduction histidine kinase/DNA-binding response OmpR family regulator